MTSSLVTDYDHGISAVDAQYHRPGRAAIHLIVENGMVALVDTGTAFSIPGVVQALKEKNLALENVVYILLTHIHLDHAGGAGECMRCFPNAKLVVHPRGARHMVDPARLIAGVIAVYGEAEFKQIYGEILPIDANRIIEAPDQTRIDLNGRTLLLLDTPGHARHHYCIYDERSHSFFTGDTFGVSYREFDVDGMEFVFPTTTPVQFDPIAAHESIDRIMSYNPHYAYLTHYSRIGNLPHHAIAMHSLIDAHVAIAKSANEKSIDRHKILKAALEKLLLQQLIQHGCKLSQQAIRDLLRSDIKLNAQGLESWLDQPVSRLKQL
ncbi:Metallo-beta-lactamase superfamily protein [Nitrosomonas cryotolerans]|uniref:Metallo-beta-lactamase superfamily protein n=1 Tax=Nitrosomonas cryotolerans ATCC 49181 TaxID=1131553 RepID=A0A1N6HXD6_9PROT|nr:MBL fold metallo-hydrolase [Nitrosomonas cryotolerans]SFP69237.1 Metallo-beta-lactamase superfamily protein [Nitrosomonas cryotolerans]SIO24426.1 Metallo-beta-lactamase superfamily protein [Nitrosomonas cryotolerans ATCC 49181]